MTRLGVVHLAPLGIQWPARVARRPPSPWGLPRRFAWPFAAFHEEDEFFRTSTKPTSQAGEQLIYRCEERQSGRTIGRMLFVDRARDVNAEFAPDGGNVATVADICRCLDGIPLAIELAAARTRALSAGQIARMLDHRFRLLTGGSRSMLERHRTLRATVQWSTDHLTPEEQALFLALSVFVGGWTLGAAARVTGCDEFDDLEQLSRLIDTSLVVTERQADAEARYRMLETLRQFGLELLASSGQADTARAAHLGHFLEVASGMEAEMREAFPIAAVKRIEPDVDNLRAALTWGFQHDSLRAADLTRRLVRLWFVPGDYEEERRWYAQTLALGDAVSTKVRANALRRSGRLALQQGNYAEALRLYMEELEIHRSAEDKHATARCLVRCGKLYIYWGRHDAARSAHEEALEIHAQLDDQDGLGRFEDLSARLQLLRYLKAWGAGPAAIRKIASPVLALSEHDILPEPLLLLSLIRAFAAASEGRRAEARALCGKALEIARSLGTVEKLWRIHRDLAELEREESEARLQAWRDVKAVISTQAAAFKEPDLRAVYLAQRERAEALRRAQASLSEHDL